MVGLPALDDGEVTGNGFFKDVLAALELTHFFALGNRGAVAGGGEERRDAGTAGAHLLGQGPLRGQLHVQLTAEQLAFEFGVFSHIGGDHLANLPVFKQHAQAEAVDAAVVRDHGQALDATPLDFADEVFRDAAQAKTTGQYRHVVGQAVKGLFIGCYALVQSGHVDPPFVVVEPTRLSVSVCCHLHRRRLIC
ncbi:hypothetical protein D3C80_1256870 [compost metagenome]